ncbi:hypothetical protein [Pseudorhodobacter ferrugineus]|nr:hypothetical protein [Pseudorhodobacter ferrugineus]
MSTRGRALERAFEWSRTLAIVPALLNAVFVGGSHLALVSARRIIR